MSFAPSCFVAAGRARPPARARGYTQRPCFSPLLAVRRLWATISHHPGEFVLLLTRLASFLCAASLSRREYLCFSACRRSTHLSLARPPRCSSFCAPPLPPQDQEQKSRLRGLDAQRANIRAARAITNVLRSSLGPKGARGSLGGRAAGAEGGADTARRGAFRRRLAAKRLLPPSPPPSTRPALCSAASATRRHGQDAHLARRRRDDHERRRDDPRQDAGGAPDCAADRGAERLAGR